MVGFVKSVAVHFYLILRISGFLWLLVVSLLSVEFVVWGCFAGLCLVW